MTAAVVAAAAALTGMSWRWVIPIGLAAVQPVVGLVVFVGIAVASRRSRDAKVAAMDAEAFYLAVSAELKGGASLRAALSESARRFPGLVGPAVGRHLAAGRPIDEIAQLVAVRLGKSGPLAGAALRVVGESGSPGVEVFAHLGQAAADEAALGRERRTATAQSRLAAGVVASLPVLFTAFALGSGVGAGALESPAGRVLVGWGLALQLSGAAVVLMMLARAAR